MSGIINTPNMSFAWAKNIQEIANGFNSMNPILEYHQQTFKVPNQKGTYNFKIGGRGYLLNVITSNGSTYSVIYYIKIDGQLRNTIQILEDSGGSGYVFAPFVGGKSYLNYERWTKKILMQDVGSSIFIPVGTDHVFFTHNNISTAYFSCFSDFSFEDNVEVSVYVDSTNREADVYINYLTYK